MKKLSITEKSVPTDIWKKETLWTECGKMRTRITPNTDTFYAVTFMQLEHNIVELKLSISVKTYKEEISMTHFHKIADELTKFLTLTSL